MLFNSILNFNDFPKPPPAAPSRQQLTQRRGDTEEGILVFLRVSVPLCQEDCGLSILASPIRYYPRKEIT